ncbi:histidine phosphatase family protein [Clostridium celatum]|mgnify:CR=1 FL=1|uniref:Phosphoglycerate mutase family protein n=1 Tax=Clostridium celatum DSM 1785 TaxID=545697 RepID=L1QP16_9CLOT|nr:histidine phosphatase family protein [Clostridium celatum]EKY29671.1 phosphoglycerate mutase family protein [Clostridium celatum DSM 1785]MCE9655757.1 histidine phosphatase family protein [Clostridium celatum]MDU2265791.1 histidine phosphatase family protein [Clostridium celatum]MDU3723926.1 histidine phosphatase family protein [Clostridium celatum]MDU6296028.1 histidine phosphatase family protein [Clostridium celatum]
MNTIIYLTRHGQTLWNIEKRLQGRGNSPLTEDGIERAKELRDRIKGMNIDVIYSSPIERALNTANIIKGDKNIEVITDDGLMEMCFGDYEGRRTDEVMKENPSWDIGLIMKGNTILSAPNGENLAEVRDRVSKTMDRIIEENRGKTILIVAHGITLKALMYYFKDDEVNDEVMGQATLTKINIDENNNFHIEYKNDNSHFTVKEQKLGW